ncbi:MAG: tRNA (adenine-N1)-methyltransferase [Candidatus Omnitrophica bacterium]|nr:tRNA (adenine-N1)-methyltransferase [Candidatus Omnitrophota bacterium]
MIEQGELIFLYSDERRNFLIKADPGRFHSDKGFIEVADILKKNFGETVETNLGHSFYILRPYLHEMIMKVRRQTQIMYPKDIGIILTRACIFPGARVIESGVGSAALTTALANFIRPNGKVYSYERNIEFLNNAKRNLIKNGLDQWVELKHQEVTTEYDQKEVDFVMIDVGSPWELIDAARSSLKGGSRLATICPTFEQLTRMVFTLEEKGFVNIESMEVQLRKILVRRGKTRPEQRMPCHTGWLVFASKTT